jgi:hypothetical protein
VRSPKKFNVHLCQKVPYVLAYLQASAAPQLENPDSNEKDTHFDLDTEITIIFKRSKIAPLCISIETVEVFFFCNQTSKELKYPQPARLSQM